jgi:hypothetical protein
MRGAMVNGVSGLTTPWLATRLGLQSAQVDALRRGGELLGVRRADGQYVYPAWQFGRGGRPLVALPRLIAAARAKGIADERLAEIVQRRAGLTGNRRLVDALREGRDDDVLRTIEGAA